MTPAELREAVARAICRDNKTAGCTCDDGYPCVSSLWDTAADAAIALVLEEAARKVPTTWLDPLLTGPGAAEIPLDGPGVEKLCRGIAAAIRALKGKV